MKKTERPATGALKLTTWNINSVRLRIALVARFVAERAPDILCLQETKVRDSEFPFAAVREMGFEHIEIHGQKGYHGVMIASRTPLMEVERQRFCDNDDARHLAVSFMWGERRIELHNFYVPAGGDEPDREINPKFGHKLDFLDEMAVFGRKRKFCERNAILVGDLNVAPLEHDVWSHKALMNIVSHTPIEVEKINAARESGRWVDVMRKFTPEHEKLYSWWSYRSPDWAKADKGRRLDHIWASPSLAEGARSVDVFKEARGWERPSDHAPVTVEFGD